MAADPYIKLARHLDSLPGGFPSTPSGVELRILRRLFTPEEAELALFLTLLTEETRVIAQRAGISVEEVAQRLAEMETKGLLFAVHPSGRPPQYMAMNFVVGIWEFQVARLTPGLIEEFEEYMPYLFEASWNKVPQLRTIPIHESIDSTMEVMTYEKAEELVRAQDRMTVTPCICRQEQRMIGKGCNKPLETCLSFGDGADFYRRNGWGRAITQEEALGILKQAQKAGLVVSPSNSQRASFICFCCGCCCAVLRSAKSHPKPADVVSSSFTAQVDPDTCIGCGLCLKRCQMEAIKLENRIAVLDADRCIGCGLCVNTCPGHSLSMKRKTDNPHAHIPKSVATMNIKLGQARGKMTNMGLARMLLKSKIDRLLSPK
jgi:NAD-dependent dihydropyrimidine dehydrogenase PreA subunit/DNA-binding Lrp family transcriptional regulator